MRLTKQQLGGFHYVVAITVAVFAHTINCKLTYLY